MLHIVPNETLTNDPALIEKVAIAIFERTQGSWEYARDADRQWVRLEAQAAIVTVLKHIKERDQIPSAVRLARLAYDFLGRSKRMYLSTN